MAAIVAPLADGGKIDLHLAFLLERVELGQRVLAVAGPNDVVAGRAMLVTCRSDAESSTTMMAFAMGIPVMLRRT